jgi:NTE family protein
MPETNFTPPPLHERKGIALCLSGGGFRAALFHLGALRRLNQLGILSKVDTITSVSGGSILSAHLADRIRLWPAAGEVFANWDEQVADPFRAFTRRDLRTGPLLRHYLLPWNWFRPDSPVKALEANYFKHLTKLTLHELAERPRFVFCSTELTFGVNWVFERERMGSYLAGYVKPAPGWPVARAVAASSCFPPIFNPMGIDISALKFVDGKFTGAERDRLLKGLQLSDGGVYDNLGLEPVWKDHQTLLSSDGGEPFRFTTARGWIGQIRRYIDIVYSQTASIRKRWLIANFINNTMNGCYWGVGSATKNYGLPNAPPGYPEDLIEGHIACIRTDLDSFSEAEASILENHGYLLAETAIHKHVPELVAHEVPWKPPHPEWLDAAKVRQALATSDQVRFLGH